MTTEQFLRDSLHEDAGTQRGPAHWDDVRERGARLRTRRRVGQGLVAVTAVVAVVAGALTITGTFSDNGGSSRRGVVATPPGPVSDQIVAGVNGKIEVLSADDGHVIRTLAEGTDPSVDAQGKVYFTRPAPNATCGSSSYTTAELARVPAAGGAPARVVGTAGAGLVSPDGHWVVYGTARCESGKLVFRLGLTDLRTGHEYTPFEQQLAAHPAKFGFLGWSPDSSEVLLVANGETWDQRGVFALRDLPPSASSSPIDVPGGRRVGAAAFLPNGHLLAARVTDPGNAYTVEELDGAGNVVGTRYAGQGFAPSLALDPSGQRLLLTYPNGSLSVLEGNNAPRLIAAKTQGATWLPAAPTGGQLVAEQGSSIVVVSALDGHVSRTIATDAAPGTGVAVTPDGATVVYARPSVKPSNPGCTKGLGTELVRVATAGGTPTQIVPASEDPVISPDGQWVAYTINICGDGPALGITSLTSGANYRPLENGTTVPASIAPMSWTPDSARVLYAWSQTAGDPRAFTLVTAPLGPQGPTPLAPSRCCVATYLPNGDLLAAFQGPGGFVLDEYGPGGSVVRSQSLPPGASPSRIAVDSAGTRILVARADGTLLVFEGSGAPRAVASGVQSAVWLP